MKKKTYIVRLTREVTQYLDIVVEVDGPQFAEDAALAIYHENIDVPEWEDCDGNYYPPEVNVVLDKEGNEV